MLAQLESQAEMIARLLSTQLDSDIDRSTKAKEKFLEWRTSFEKQRKSFFRTQFSLLGDIVGIALAQCEDEPVLPLAIRRRRAQASIVSSAGDPSNGVTSMVYDPILPRESPFGLAPLIYSVLGSADLMIMRLLTSSSDGSDCGRL